MGLTVREQQLTVREQQKAGRVGFFCGARFWCMIRHAQRRAVLPSETPGGSLRMTTDLMMTVVMVVLSCGLCSALGFMLAARRTDSA